MKVVTGKVVSGKIEVEGEPLEEGTTVPALASESNGVFVLQAGSEEALLATMAEANRGETITSVELMSGLRKWL